MIFENNLNLTTYCHEPTTIARSGPNTKGQPQYWGIRRCNTKDSRLAAAMKEVGEPDCTFCEKLHASEADASAEASAYTNENFPDLNDDPPLL